MAGSLVQNAALLVPQNGADGKAGLHGWR